MSTFELVLAGVVGVAAVLLIVGAATVVAGRRREAAAAAASREQRARRRHVQLEEDPIVAALGIGGDTERGATRVGAAEQTPGRASRP